MLQFMCVLQESILKAGFGDFQGDLSGLMSTQLFFFFKVLPLSLQNKKASSPQWPFLIFSDHFAQRIWKPKYCMNTSVCTVCHFRGCLCVFSTDSMCHSFLDWSLHFMKFFFFGCWEQHTHSHDVNFEPSLQRGTGHFIFASVLYNF